MQPPPQKPGQIRKADFARFEIITQANIHSILEEVEEGKRPPLNFVALPYQDYLILASWMEDIERYILQAEIYFKEIDRRWDEFTSRSLP